MALIIEDGTGMSTSQAYQSAADVAAWLVARGLSSFDALTEAAQESTILLETSQVDAFLRTRVSGRRVKSTQALLWPRLGATAVGYRAISSTETPGAITRSLAYRCEDRVSGAASLGEAASGVKRMKSAKVETEFFENTAGSFRRASPQGWIELLPLMVNP